MTNLHLCTYLATQSISFFLLTLLGLTSDGLAPPPLHNKNGQCSSSPSIYQQDSYLYFTSEQSSMVHHLSVLLSSRHNMNSYYKWIAIMTDWEEWTWSNPKWKGSRGLLLWLLIWWQRYGGCKMRIRRNIFSLVEMCYCSRNCKKTQFAFFTNLTTFQKHSYWFGICFIIVCILSAYLNWLG